MSDLLAVVPARGGSVGIPRKNTRVLDGQPLVLNRLETLRAAGIKRIVCSTDDPIIASIARINGYEVHDRRNTAGPTATIGETMAEVVADLEWSGPVGVFQCTSPGLGPERIRDEIDAFMQDDSLLTAASVVAVHDVCYTADSVIGAPVNRQYQNEPALWRTTGGMRLIKDPSILPETIDLDGHHLIELDSTEATDIDDHGQFAAARQLQVPLTFMVAVGHDIGSGHLHRCLTLADELAHHDVRFRLIHGDPDPLPDWERMVNGAGYRMLEEAPRGGIVVLDALDVKPTTVWMLRQMGHKVVSLEDGGPGGRLAHLAIDELSAGGDFTGPNYAIVRPEFLTPEHAPSAETDPDVVRILVCFGGTDPSGTGPRVATLIPQGQRQVRGVTARVVYHATLGLPGESSMPIAEAMATCHLFVGSCGRLIHEAACVGIPTIGIPVNQRETAHAKLASVLYLPRCELVSDREIMDAIGAIANAPGLRSEMSAHGRSLVDGYGCQRVARLIDGLCEES